MRWLLVTTHKQDYEARMRAETEKRKVEAELRQKEAIEAKNRGVVYLFFGVGSIVLGTMFLSFFGLFAIEAPILLWLVGLVGIGIGISDIRFSMK
jgi:hypothetical protein